MKKRHTFAFYCTLMLPIGFFLGADIGAAVGQPALLSLVGAAAGATASFFASRRSNTAETS